MKKSKILVPALALLAMSSAATVTGTVAWFSMNQTVTATGMEVTATAPTSLLISTTSASAGFKSSATLANANGSAPEKFVPVSYAGVCEAFYQLTSDAMATVDENGVATGFSAVADGTAATSFTGAKVGTQAAYEVSNSFYHDTVWLKVEGEKDQDVTVNCKYLASPSMAIKAAMHVVFVVDSAVAATVDMGGDTGSGVTTAKIATLTANAAGTSVDVYYFLSGLDTDCKNSNITADTTLSIDLKFDATEHTA